MSDMIPWMAAEAEKPFGGEDAKQLGRNRDDEEELVRRLPKHQFPVTTEGQDPHLWQNRPEVGHPAVDENQTAAEGATYEVLEDEPDVERQRRIYRNRTVAMLRRYMRYSIETGRLPSILGREFFRAKVTSYTVVTFEDRVIFVHDMERCLEKLDEFSRKVLARIVLQEYQHEDAAQLLGCTRMTVHRKLIEALDLLSYCLLEVGLLDRLVSNRENSCRNSCQGGNSGPFSASDCEDGK
jgi:hypothetical protein